MQQCTFLYQPLQVMIFNLYLDVFDSVPFGKVVAFSLGFIVQPVVAPEPRLVSCLAIPSLFRDGRGYRGEGGLPAAHKRLLATPSPFSWCLVL